MSLETLDNAVAALTHRGPDSSDTWVSENKTMLLGHTRLSIIDPDRVRDAFSMVKMLQGDQKIAFECLIHKVASITLMQERFGMT